MPPSSLGACEDMLGGRQRLLWRQEGAEVALAALGR